MFVKGKEGGVEIKPVASFERQHTHEGVSFPEASLVPSWEHPKLSCCMYFPKSEVLLGLEPALCIQKINKTEVRRSNFVFLTGCDKIRGPRKRYIPAVSVLIHNYYMFFLL